jgi:hypothetical protein
MVKTCAIALAVGLAIICGVTYETEGFGGNPLICTGVSEGSATCQSVRHGLLEGLAQRLWSVRLALTALWFIHGHAALLATKDAKVWSKRASDGIVMPHRFCAHRAIWDIGVIFVGHASA